MEKTEIGSVIRKLAEEIGSGTVELEVKLSGVRSSMDTVESNGQGLIFSNCLP